MRRLTWSQRCRGEYGGIDRLGSGGYSVWTGTRVSWGASSPQSDCTGRQGVNFMSASALTLSVRAKRYAARRAMEWLVEQFRRDPVDTVLSWGKRSAVAEARRQQITELEEAMRENPVIRQNVRRIALEVLPNQHRGVVFSWFINKLLLGTPVRRALAGLGYGAPNLILVDGQRRATFCTRVAGLGVQASGTTCYRGPTEGLGNCRVVRCTRFSREG